MRIACDVARAGGLQSFDRAERGVVFALLGPHFRAGDQPGGVNPAIVFGTLQPFVAPLVLLHAVRGARAQQRRDGGGGTRRLRCARRLLGARETPFEQAAHRLEQGLLAADLLAPCSIQPDLFREITTFCSARAPQ